MSYSLNSTLLLTILLAIGLFFFLRASSKDRTTIVEISSSQQPVKVLNGLCEWLNLRGWKQTGGDFEQRILIFKGQVVSSKSRIKIKVTSYYNFLELFCKILLLDKNS